MDMMAQLSTSDLIIAVVIGAVIGVFIGLFILGSNQR